MRLVITEKQLRGIIKSGEVKEQDATTPPSSPDTSSEPSSTPSTGDGETGGGGSGYPSVTKWESGVTRGAGNQVGITKWSDVVGNTINRGKSNPLN
jgi:hypothetical protein